MRVGLLRETRFRIAGQGNEFCAHALDDRQDGKNLAGLAGIGNGYHDIDRLNHAEVAMLRLARVYKEGRSAGARQRGGDLAADVSGLAHAGYDHAAGATENQATGAREVLVDARHERAQRFGLKLNHGAAELL